MAHIILKTVKTNSAQAKMAEPSAPIGAQPMVIDFSKQRTRLISANVLYVLLGAAVSFFITSLIALFILGDQLNHLWRDAQHAATQHVQIAAPAPQESQQPEAAFPAATITPLPSKAFIMGKDFQKTKSPDKIDLVPLLERMPVGRPDKPAQSTKTYIEVEAPTTLTKAARLQQQAEEAMASGKTNKAVELYLRAVASSPKDATLRSNCVALLLEQARAHDEQGDVMPAIASYKKAERLWQGDAQTAKAIKARIRFLENN